MDRLIEDLLDVMRIEAGELRLERAPVSPYALLQEAAQTARPLAAAAGIEVLVDLERHMPAVRADRARVVQVLDNLVGNALKFTPRGGRIALCAARRGAEALFSVSDTGSGLEPHALARLFEQGWEGRRDPRGLGLGLAIVKGIVEAHGGRVWAESTPGLGATFHFTLPLLS
jgi:signal transduction histidine kinase